MKRLLVLVLAIAGLCAHAGAAVQKEEVLIYSFTEKSTEYTGVTDMGNPGIINWSKSTTADIGYLVFQENPSQTFTIWAVKMLKVKDKAGKTRKIAFVYDWGEYSFVEADIGKKKTWLVSSASEDVHVLLTGDEKPVWLYSVDKTARIPAKLAGTSNWYYNEGVGILSAGSSTLSLRFQLKFTNEFYANASVSDGYEMARWIQDYLVENKGYSYPP